MPDFNKPIDYNKLGSMFDPRHRPQAPQENLPLVPEDQQYMPRIPPPPLPDAPAMFRPDAPPDRSADVLAALKGGPSSIQPSQSDVVRKGGISYGGPVDWASERAGFLNRENPFAGDIKMRADALEARRQIDENLGNRPDLLDDMRNQYALQGLRRASEQADPEYQRQQEDADAIQQALTFMNPQVAQARHMRTGEAVNQQRELGNAELERQTDPRQQMLDLIKFLRQQSLYETQATGRNPILAMMSRGGLGGAPAAPGAPGAAAPKRDPMGIR